MYPEYKKVDEFIRSASLVMNKNKTMQDVFTLICQRNANKVAVEYYDIKGKLKHYKYSKMKVNVFSFASTINNILKADGLHYPVGLKIANNQHWGEMFWAILMAGYKPLLIDARLPKEGTSNILTQSHAIAIVTDDVYSYDVTKISFDDIVDIKVTNTISPVWENEVIFCSSGTTGDVKLMIYNGEAICHQICCSLDLPKETKDIMYPEKYGKLKILAMIPFHHIFGFVAVFLWYTFYGKTMVFPRAITPSEIQKVCQKNGVTHVYSVPLFWDSLALNTQRKVELLEPERKELFQKFMQYNLGKVSKKEAGKAGWDITRCVIQKMLLGPKLRFCISGGGFLSNETITTINALGYPLSNGYGMTEIGVTSVELSSDVNERLKCSIGKPFHGVEYKIGDNHELLVKSPTLHIREIIGGKEQKTILDKDGFFQTGDIAESDQDGRYYLKGRIKDIIINANGENIFPDELEESFKSISFVGHLVVLGVKIANSHEEKVTLVLELENGVTDEQLEMVKAQVKERAQHLPHNVKISDVFLAKNKLPLANGIKVKRFLVKKSLENGSKDYVSINVKKETKKFDGFDEKTINSILVPMREIFAKVLVLSAFKIEDDANWIDDLGGDSMNYVELIKEVQERFDITFPEEKLGVMATVNDFVYEVAVLIKENAK
ncbi:MAG TPA: AMP-binding protein [Bacilli bacterium]|nr:AMP-binding protein [Bacilli bacterium]